MKKSILLILTGALLAGAFIIAKPVDTKAAQPCTYDIINDANAKIASAQNAYNLAVANEANCKAAFEAVKNQGPASLAYVQAANAYENARNQTAYALSVVANAQAYLANINGRAAYEDGYLGAIDALHVLNNVQQAQQDAKNALDIANAVAVQMKDIQTAINGYKQQLATCPSVQSQIDALNAQLAALQADYNNKLAIANQKAAAYQTLVAAGGYQNYDKKYIDAYYNRERYVEASKCMDIDFFTGVVKCSCGKDCRCDSTCTYCLNCGCPIQ